MVLCHTAYYVKKLWIWWKLWRFFFVLLWGKILVNFGSMGVEMTTSVSQDTFSLQNDNKFDVMMLLQCIIASVGTIANLTVVVVFLNHKELRRKIPNRFIINQVSIFITKLACICRVFNDIWLSLLTTFYFFTNNQIWRRDVDVMAHAVPRRHRWTNYLIGPLIIKKQEWIPVGCVPPVHHRAGGLPDRDPLHRDPPDRDHPWTEAPRTETPVDRDPIPPCERNDTRV